MKTSFNLNGKRTTVDVEDDTTLLWALRETLKLTGTKFGCGIAQCGACTVHMDGNAVKSCSIPISAVEGKNIRTIEGLKSNDSLHPVQQAWVEHQVPQCGYCQSGQIMQAVALLEDNPTANRSQIIQAMNGVICRCGAHMRILKAIQSVSKKAEL